MEEWRDIPGYEGYYQVSSEGRVKRLARYVNSKNGSFALKRTKILSPHFPKEGYPHVGLCRENKRKTLNVHQLVCEAFHGPRPSPDHEAAHNDGTKDNNHRDNLRWATPAENAADRKTHGTERMGEAISHMTHLTAGDVLAIREKYRPEYGSLAKLGREYGVTNAAILSIVKRKNWKHV